MADLERIYDKLRKIKALEGSPTTGEAEAAAQAFYRVLARHNLSMAMWERVAEEEPRSRVNRHDVMLRNSASWRSTLFSVVARANFCRSIKGWENREYLFGEQRNIDASMEMYDWLEGLVDRVADGYPPPPGEPVRSFRNAFRYGMVIGISEALREEREKIEDPDLKAMVPVLKDAVDAAVNQEFPQLTNRRGPSLSSGAGYAIGKQEGRKVRRKRGQLPA